MLDVDIVPCNSSKEIYQARNTAFFFVFLQLSGISHTCTRHYQYYVANGMYERSMHLLKLLLDIKYSRHTVLSELIDFFQDYLMIYIVHGVAGITYKVV